MCIILYKPKGAKLPTKKTLQICFANNNDGAGLTVINENCRSRKGFMEFQDLWAAYKNECFTSASEFALHFRLATAGDISKGNCHPFPIVNNVRELRQKKFKSNQIVMHNGILGFGSRSLSDTMLYIKNELYALRNHLKNPGTVKYIKSETWGSQLLIIDYGKVTLTGSWITDKDTGIKYSNDRFRKYDVHNDRCWVDRVKSTDATTNTSSGDRVFMNNLDDYDEDDIICPECLNYDTDFIESVFLDEYPGDKLYECYLCDTIFNDDQEVFVEGCDISDDDPGYEADEICPYCDQTMLYNSYLNYWYCTGFDCDCRIHCG